MKKIYPYVISKIGVFKRYLRYLFLNEILDIKPEDLIVDIGCGKDGRSYEVFNQTNKIIGVDLLDPKEVEETLKSKGNFQYIQRDADDLSIFGDEEFDAPLCIGVLEHIVDKDKLSKVCKEIRRISKKYAVVVPWKYAFLEPHFKLPFFQLYPKNIQYELIRKFNLHGIGKCSFDYFKNHYQWLSTKELHEYFPDGRICLSLDLYTIVIWKR